MIAGSIVAVSAIAVFGALLWIVISQAKDKAVADLIVELETDAAKKLEKANDIINTTVADDAAEQRLRDGSF